MRPGPTDDGAVRLCFFAERQVGIGSVAELVQRYLRRLPGLELTWTDVTYARDGGLIERLPFVPKGWRGVARGFLQTGEGLRRGPYDALFFLTHNPAVLRPSAVRETPTCLWTDVTPLQLDQMAKAYGFADTRAELLARWKRAAVTRTFRRARRCIGWSEWARRSFVRDYGVPEERTAVVPPGIDLEIWRVPERPPADARRPFRILFVGGDFARKGGPQLLQVFRGALRDRCTLDVVTREAVPEEPGVRVHHGLSPGSEPLLALYREADAFVLPTLADCHAVASLEAMATGLPVVSTRVGAIPEVVEHERSGFVLEPGDPRTLRDAVLALAGDRSRAREMGGRGRAIVERTFHAARTAQLLFEQVRAAAASA